MHGVLSEKTIIFRDFPLATTFKLVLRIADPLLETRFLVDAADGM